MNDAYQTVTDRILACMDEGGEWSPPWRINGAMLHPVNARTKSRYRGVNVLTCWATAVSQGYATSEWASFNQWKDMGAQVRKGERGTPIVFFKEYDKAADDGTAERHVVARLSYVFNAAQVEGYAPKLVGPDAEPLSPEARIARCEFIKDATGARVEEGHAQPCYVPSVDLIRMPAFEVFKQPESFYSVCFHELVHWTGAETRLDRKLSTKFGSHAYAAEELIAELAAAFLAAETGIDNAVRSDNAAYLKAWAAMMKEDKRAVVRAASEAARAVDHILEYAALKEGELRYDWEARAA